MTNEVVTTLPNGLRVATDYMGDVETVSISIWVHTGSRNEPKELNGISHFLEHMAFKGTKTRTAKDIAEQFDDIGGVLNAFTSREYTVYYAKVLKEDVEKAVEILSDILQNSIFSHEEMEKERQVILQEIAMTNDIPDDIIFDYHQETAFSNQPAGWPIIGSVENVSSFTQEQLKEYIHNQYNTKNIIIAAAGNMKHNNIVSLVKKYFCSLNQNKIKKPEKAVYTGGEFIKQKDLEQVHLLLGFQGYSYNHDDFYTVNILSVILGGGISSRLFQEVREKRGLAYTIYASNTSMSDSGIFDIYAAANEEKVNELIKTTCEEMLEATENINGVELNRAVTQVKARLLMGCEKTDARANRLGKDLLSFDRVIDLDEIIEKVEAITTKDLCRVMENIISGGKITFSCLGSTKDIYGIDDIKKIFSN